MKVILEQEKYEEMLNDFILKELYKKRIDKAIEYIEKYNIEGITFYSVIKDDLLNILQGVDKE